MKYATFFLLMLCLFSSCDRNTNLQLQENMPEDEEDFFPGFKVGNIHPDTLYLYVQLDDCGEWGGPPEKFRLYVDSLRQYQLEYKRYRFNCDSIGKYYSRKKPLELATTITLNESSKKTVSDFLGKIMRAKISESVDSNAGSIYSIHSNDSTFDVAVYSTKKRIKEDFYIFKKSLGLPENRYQDRAIAIPL